LCPALASPSTRLRRTSIGKHARGLAGGDHEVAVVLDEPEASRSCRQPFENSTWLMAMVAARGAYGLQERLEAQDALHGGHEVHGHAAVDPGQA
jgi:hypothetical protein